MSSAIRKRRASQESFVRSLLGSQDMPEACQNDTAAPRRRSSCKRVHLAWNARTLGQEHSHEIYPAGPVDTAISASADARASFGRDDPEQPSPRRPQRRWRLPARPQWLPVGDPAVIGAGSRSPGEPWNAAQRGRKTLDLLALRCESLLQTERLRLDAWDDSRVPSACSARCSRSAIAPSSDHDTATVLHEHAPDRRPAHVRAGTNFFIVRYNANPEERCSSSTSPTAATSIRATRRK